MRRQIEHKWRVQWLKKHARCDDETHTEVIQSNPKPRMVRRRYGVAARVMGPLWASNVWGFSFPDRTQEGLNMAKQTAMSAAAESEKPLDLTATYFSTNAAVTAVSSDRCVLKRRTRVLPRNRERKNNCA